MTMIDYKKIAIISVRILAISFLISGIFELVSIVAAMILVTRGTIPQELVVQETWFIQASTWIAAGAFLHFRTRSLGAVIVERLFPEDPPSENDDERTEKPGPH